MMQNVYFVFEMPDNQDYMGGIAVILKQYLQNEALFVNHGYSVNLLNLSNARHSGGKIKVLLNAYRERQYAKNFFDNVEDESVIHMHSSRKWTLLKDMFIAKKIRKEFNGKMVLSIHFADIDKILYTNSLLRTFQLNSMQCFDKVIFLSKKTQNEFIEAGINKENTEVIYTFHGFRDMDNIKADQGRINILFVGSIDKRKGIIDLLRAAIEVKDLDFCINVCGQFTDEQVKVEFQTYQSLLGDKIVYRGYISGQEKKSLFKQSDVLVLPSYGEGMPIVIMEAMSAGCAIISTDVGAIPEIIEEDNGILIQPGDIKALRLALEKMITDRSYVERIKQNNVSKGKAFGIESNIALLCSVYDR